MVDAFNLKFAKLLFNLTVAAQAVLSVTAESADPEVSSAALM